ncbi:MAG: lysophospholipid acyltransferase family protein [candidate division Zixibacteria bacterium]|nr:lysophospholipid acyltransferase family protein [candidate division Zixibacteria bacterium]
MGKIPWSKSKKRLKNWLIYRFILILISFLNLLPRRLSLSIGRSLGKLAYLILPESRSTTLQNLKIAFPNLGTGSIKKISLKVFECLGRNAVDAIRLPKMSWEEIQKITKVEGIEHLEKAYSQGRGVMGVTGHIGNFELLAAYVSLQGYKLSAIGRELYDPRLNELLIKNRQMMGVQNIYSTASVKEVIKVLNSGRMIGVLIDQDTSRVKGIYVDFFGRKARTPVGPAILALKLGVPIVPMAIIQTKKGNYKIMIHKEIKPLVGKTKEENIYYLTQKCTEFLEQVIREYPDQWVWMHKRWLRTPDNP